MYVESRKMVLKNLFLLYFQGRNRGKDIETRLVNTGDRRSEGDELSLLAKVYVLFLFHHY